QWIDCLRDSGFVGEDLLCAQRDAGSFFCGKRKGFVEGICVQRLRSSQHSRKRLQSHTRDVVHRLLGWKRYPRGLRMTTHQPGALIFSAKAIFHYAMPNLAGGAIFSDLLKEIVVRIKEEAETRTKFIYIKTAPPRPFHVLNAVIQGKCQLLQGCRSRLADVISADRNRVKAWGEL